MFGSAVTRINFERIDSVKLILDKSELNLSDLCLDVFM